jgi:integrase
MPARKDAGGRWRFQKVVRLPSGAKVRISGTPKLNTKLDAEHAERLAIAAVLAVPDNQPPIPTFGQVAARYMEVAELEQAPSEFAFKRRRLRSTLLPMLGAVAIDRIGRLELDAIKVRMRDKAPRTVNNTLSVVGAVLGYAVKCRQLAERPELGMLRVPPQDYEVYTDDELARLLASSAGFDRAAVLLGCDAGLRIGEIRALRREDVGPTQLRVCRSDWYGITKAPKSGRARVVPANERLREALARCLDQHAGPTVLARANGCAWNEETGRAAITRITRAAGMANRGWHALRHAFCSRLAARGVPARTIQALAGHASITTTERYMHVAPEALASATALLEQEPTR